MGCFWARSLPMPTDCEPWPGNSKANAFELIMKLVKTKSCHPERSEGPMHFAGGILLQATYIGPSRKRRAQDDRVSSVAKVTGYRRQRSRAALPPGRSRSTG